MAKDNNVIDFICVLEGFKTAIKNLHWSSKNLSQHKLCDDIADALSDFQDKVAEVEQSINGKFNLNVLKPTPYKEKDLRTFVEDVIEKSNTFMNSLKGKDYVGMKSDCESFLSDMQRNLYLVDFTLKEELKRGLRESFRREENIKTSYHGKAPSTEGGMFKRINDLTKNGQLNTRVFNSIQDAFDFNYNVLGTVGELKHVASHGNNILVQLDANNGMSYAGLMKVKELGGGKIKTSITFSPHGEESVEEDDASYELYGEGAVISLTSEDFKSLLRESIELTLESSGIHIKKENEGKFTETKKRTGKSTEELTHSKNPLTRKRAIFAQNAKKWSHNKTNESIDGLSATQTRNMLGVDDNDELNAACNAEAHEDLELEIWNGAREAFGADKLRDAVLDFGDFCNFLENEFGFQYVGNDDDNEAHVFKNGEETLEVFPKNYYPSLGKFRIENISVS